MKGMVTTKERYLAASVFMLWSLGAVLLPALDKTSSVLDLPVFLTQSLLFFYIALHAAVFAFAFWALVARLRVDRSRGWRRALPLLVYLYAVLMLCISLYLLLPVAFGLHL